MVDLVPGFAGEEVPHRLVVHLLVEDVEPSVGAFGPRNQGPARLSRISDAQIAVMHMALRMSVEELSDERPSRTLDLRDENEGLAYIDEILDQRKTECTVLVGLGATRPASGRARRS